MDTRDTARQVIAAYSRLFNLFYRRRNPRDYRPRPEALAIMEHLMGSGPLTVNEAACHFDLSQSATSEHIQRLVKRGLLARLPDERDRRRHLVWLSPKGRSLLEEERQVLSQDLVERALKTMTREEQKQLTDSLNSLCDAALAARPKQASSKKGRKHD